MLWADLKPILVAVAVGVMIGAERERSLTDGQAHFGGVRTFAILAATGALAGLVSDTIVAVGFVAIAVLVALGYWGTIKTHPGSTTAVAALATYLLGALTHTQAGLAVGVGVLVVVLLLSKERLHRLLRDVVSDTEVSDAVKLLVLVFVVLPLLPDRPMGPYGVLNPFRLWLLVVTVVGMGWAGYLGVRLFGAKRGLLVSGFAGGFVSASATTAAMGRHAAAAPADARAALAGALAASVSTMVQLVLVVGVVSRPVVEGLLAPALGASALLGAAIAVTLRLGGRRVAALDDLVSVRGDDAPATGATRATTPVRAFALRPALVLTGVITATVLLSRWASHEFGSGATAVVAAIAGLADGHAGAVAAASLAARGDLSAESALWAIAASLGTNTLVKVALAFVAGGASFGRAFLAGIVPAVAAFVAALLLT